MLEVVNCTTSLSPRPFLTSPTSMMSDVPSEPYSSMRMLAFVPEGRYDTIKRVFFARVYFTRFSCFEFHLRKIQDRENFNVDYFYRFRPFFVQFGCFLGICSLLSSMLFAHSRKIHARENIGRYMNNRRARNIPVLQYVICVCSIEF